MDTFNIVGQYDSREPSTFGCQSCEVMYEVYWMMTDFQCEVLWSPFFADQEPSDPERQEYYGFISLDTHGGWDIRSPEMLVVQHLLMAISMLPIQIMLAWVPQIQQIQMPHHLKRRIRKLVSISRLC